MNEKHFIRAECEICERKADCKKLDGRTYCVSCHEGIKHANKVMGKK